MYEHMTFDNIMQEMLSKIPTDIDTREGSVIYDSLAPVAIELAQMYIDLDVILIETFGSTASRDFLIKRAFERGITPTLATYALWKGEFDIAVDIGARFSVDELNFVVTEILSDTTFVLQCESIGTIGNYAYGTMIPIEYIQGLSYAKLTELLIPAQDDEDTEVFRKRYLASFDSQAFGGNVTDYLAKTNAIDGVGAVKVTPIWNGGGTVKLTILDAEYNKATETLIESVQEIIDPKMDGLGIGLAPIGHVVTVETVELIEVIITSKITFDTGYSFDNLKGLITEAVQEYMLDLRKEWADYTNLILRIAMIESKIIAIKGVIDITYTKINGIDENLLLNNYQIAELIEVNIDD